MALAQYDLEQRLREVACGARAADSMGFVAGAKHLQLNADNGGSCLIHLTRSMQMIVGGFFAFYCYD